METQGCNSIDIWNLRLELRHNLRQGVKDVFRKALDRAMVN